MNKRLLFKLVVIFCVLLVIGAVVLTGKTTWSLSDEKPGPKMIECIFQGYWSKILGIRIVIKQVCGGI